MAVRFGGSSFIGRSANLPTTGAYTLCGWARIVVDRNNYSAITALGLSGTAEHILTTDSDGTTIRLWSNSSFQTGTFVPGVGVPFFWAMRGSAAGGGGIQALLRTNAQNTFSTITGSNNTFIPNYLDFGDDSFGEYFNGDLWNIKVWNRALSNEELLIESFFERPQFPASLNIWLPLYNANDTADRSGNGRNPTINGALTTGDSAGQLWRPKQRRIKQAASGGTAVLVDLSVTDVADTLSGAAGVTVGVALSASDAADTLSAAATLPISVGLAATDAADTLSAAASLPIVASLSVTDASDTLASASGVLVVVGLSVTDEADTLDATAVVGNAPVEVTLSVTDASDTLSAAAALTVGVSLAVTDAADTLAAASTMPVSVALSVTDAADTLASTVGSVVGVALAATDEADALAATATVQQEGVIAVTLDVTDQADTLAATAVISGVPVVVGSSMGFELVDHESKSWWKRKPKSLPDAVAKKKLKQVAKAIDELAAEKIEQDEPIRQRDVRDELAPLLAEMPGFDWRPLFRAVVEYRQQEAARLEAMAQIERIRAIERDDDDVLALLMSF